MNKKLQKQILNFIREVNNSKRTAYNQIVNDINVEFATKRGINQIEVANNLNLLIDAGMVEGDNALDQSSPHGPLRITNKGYGIFDPWYKKLWEFFNNDMAKFLSVLATILSIISIIISLLK